jgi:platelet-activating factor acetylhydrolase
MEFLSRFNPVPQFPAYKGPYNVGSFDVEIPVSSLSDASTRTPGPAEGISTVQFRVFYPTSRKDQEAAPIAPTGAAENENEEIEKEATEGKGMAGWASSWFKRHAPQAATPAQMVKPTKPVYWLPEPHQREYLSGYARFLGAGSGLAELISYVLDPRSWSDEAKLMWIVLGTSHASCTILRCPSWSPRR